MVTLRDIAVRAGVSRATAGLVLSGEGTAARFKSDTRERVLQAARELGYRPNASAKAISTGRFGCIALLLSNREHRSAVYSQMLDGIHDALAEQDLHLMLSRASDERLTSEGFVPKILRHLLVDGLLINYNTDIPPPLLEMVRAYRIPSTWINSKQETDCVYLDDFAASHDATTHLLGLGHRRIAFLAYSPSSHYSMADRQAGYEAAMTAAGYAPESIAVPSTAFSGRRYWEQIMRERLSAPNRPTALIAYGPPALRPAFVAALRVGLRIPEDISFIVFDQSPFDEFGLPIATMLLPEYRMGQAAVKMLLTKIEHPEESLTPQALRMELAAGESCASPLKQS
jgi:LacI family transcriptional regulator